MNNKERDLVLDLAQEKISKDHFLRNLGRGEDGRQVSEQLLKEATASKNGEDLECALIASFVFGITQGHLSPLIAALNEQWHSRHEDVVDAIALLKSPIAINALYASTQWVPGYLSFDDSRALASKAIWALGAIEDGQAQEALERLVSSSDNFLSKRAVEQISKRANRYKGGVLP
jgi:hypothetical protein